MSYGLEEGHARRMAAAPFAPGLRHVWQIWGLWRGSKRPEGRRSQSCDPMREPRSRIMYTPLLPIWPPDGASMTMLSSARLVAPVFALAFAFAGCGESKQQAAAPPPPPVTVAKPVQRTVVDQDEYVGRFVAIDAVEIRARVSGYLDQVHFKDGQIVKQGDLLFTVDKRPFQNALAQARAT